MAAPKNNSRRRGRCDGRGYPRRQPPEPSRQAHRWRPGAARASNHIRRTANPSPERKRKINKRIASIALALSLAGPAAAAPAPEDPAKQTSWGLYLSSQEAYDMKTARSEEVLFVD